MIALFRPIFISCFLYGKPVGGSSALYNKVATLVDVQICPDK